MKNKFLVVGGNSFSGSHLINYLLNLNCEVISVSRSNEPNHVFLPYKALDLKLLNFSFYKIDLNKDLDLLINIIEKNQPDYIINFAAQGMVAESWLNPAQWYNTNVTANVIFHDKIRKFKYIKKYIHVTTPEVYGNTEGWLKENFNFSPSTPYAVSRAACDMHLMSFYKAYNFPVIFTRSANVYGPGQQLYRIIPKTFLSAKIGKKFNLHGGGVSVRSFIHILDVVKATYLIAIHGKPGETYHISTNETISIRNLVKKICLLTNSDFNELVNITDDRLGKDMSYLLDSSKLRTALNWKENININTGLDLTFEWINKNIDILKNFSLEYKHKT